MKTTPGKRPRRRTQRIKRALRVLTLHLEDLTSILEDPVRAAQLHPGRAHRLIAERSALTLVLEHFNKHADVIYAAAKAEDMADPEMQHHKEQDDATTL